MALETQTSDYQSFTISALYYRWNNMNACYHNLNAFTVKQSAANTGKENSHGRIQQN